MATALAWGAPTAEGTAVGETSWIDVEGHDEQIRVTPLWSDEEGVTADVDIPDVPLSVNTLAKLVDIINRVSMMSPLY